MLRPQEWVCWILSLQEWTCWAVSPQEGVCWLFSPHIEMWLVFCPQKYGCIKYCHLGSDWAERCYHKHGCVKYCTSFQKWMGWMSPPPERVLWIMSHYRNDEAECCHHKTDQYVGCFLHKFGCVYCCDHANGRAESCHCRNYVCWLFS